MIHLTAEEEDPGGWGGGVERVDQRLPGLRWGRAVQAHGGQVVSAHKYGTSTGDQLTGTSEILAETLAPASTGNED